MQLLNYLLVAVATACLSILAGCQPPPHEAPPAPATTAEEPTGSALELKNYAVKPEQREEVASVLRSALARGEEPVGRVVEGPGAQVVVVAPASLHEGIPGLLEHLAAQAPEKVVAAEGTLTYWIVVGKAAAEPSTRGLDEVKTATDAIQKLDGPMSMELAEKVVVSSIENEHAFTRGRFAEVGQTFSHKGDVVVADLEIRLPGDNQIRTRARIKPDQHVVLSQVGLDPEIAAELRDAAELDQSGTFRLYYIVRASLP